MNVILSIAHGIWLLAVWIESHLLLPLYHRWKCINAAKASSIDDNLVLCHYLFTDGQIYTLVQQSSVPSQTSLIICCAVLTYLDGQEIDITKKLITLAGPHLDFHGSELTVTELLSCIDHNDKITLDSRLLSLTIATEQSGHYTEYIFKSHEFVNIVNIIE